MKVPSAIAGNSKVAIEADLRHFTSAFIGEHAIQWYLKVIQQKGVILS